MQRRAASRKSSSSCRLNRGTTEVLAGGTDLVGLMKKMIVTPDRVVSLDRVASLKTMDADSQGFRIGAMVTLDDLADHPATRHYPALRQAMAAIGSMQMLAQGTLGGELCQRPRCWYFRAGGGLLANQGRAIAEGDNRLSRDLRQRRTSQVRLPVAAGPGAGGA